MWTWYLQLAKTVQEHLDYFKLLGRHSFKGVLSTESHCLWDNPVTEVGCVMTAHSIVSNAYNASLRTFNPLLTKRMTKDVTLVIKYVSSFFHPSLGAILMPGILQSSSISCLVMVFLSFDLSIIDSSAGLWFFVARTQFWPFQRGTISQHLVFLILMALPEHDPQPSDRSISFWASLTLLLG